MRKEEQEERGAGGGGEEENSVLQRMEKELSLHDKHLHAVLISHLLLYDVLFEYDFSEIV